MRRRRCSFVPQVDFLTLRVVPSTAVPPMAPPSNAVVPAVAPADATADSASPSDQGDPGPIGTWGEGSEISGA